MKDKGEIIVYQSDTTLQLEVRMEDETVWLTQAQMVELFQSSKANISEHIKNIYESSELTAHSTVRKFRTVRLEGGRKIARNLDYYNLDVIISVGYRVNTKCGIRFRQWATNVIKSYLLKGYTINQRIELIEQRMNSKFSEYDEKFDFFIKTSLPPVEGVFYDGQLFDAYKFASDLIRTATKSLILIDNYIDDTVLTLFTKRIPGVIVTIYTAQISKQLSLDLQRHNSQYEPIDIRQFKQSHDRFLIIDEKELYHIGASLKDLGKKWFAFSKMQLDIKEVLKHL
ncbi:virulence RhuM family protein [Parabacteroides faecis]|uniref:virulence RhuM family protein n=1 Tax=Parabacteroides faecis TaxID=1217282 RepID=UPI002164589B|nr:RhuM family protein [Parabacteroides faecis]MCS2892291.1 virulence RhuM family protein [Parabacteroides faecis]UVQ49070.1 virulence RhuM family protein [Parabacteroides faecis]